MWETWVISLGWEDRLEKGTATHSSILAWKRSPAGYSLGVTLLGFSSSLIDKESACNAGDPSLIPGSGRSTGEGISTPLQYFGDFTGGSASKESAYDVGDLGLIPGLRRSPGDGKDYPLQYSGLENSIDFIVHGVAKSWTELSHFHFHLYKRVWPCSSLAFSELLKTFGFNLCWFVDSSNSVL